MDVGARLADRRRRPAKSMSAVAIHGLCYARQPEGSLETKIQSPMGRWLILREVTERGEDGRTWIVDDLSEGLQFRATLTRRSLHATPEGWTPLHGEPDEDDILLAVGHAVDNSIVALGGNAQRGVSYAIMVNSQEVYEARQMVSRSQR